MDPRGEKLFELFTKNLRYVEECKSRLRSLNKKFDELTASDKKAELDAINALHKSILIKELPEYKVRTWRMNNSTLKKLLRRCAAEEEAHLNEANKSNTDNPDVAKGVGVNHNAVDNENCSAGDSGIPPSASARPPKRGAQAKKAKTGKRNKKKKQKDTRQSNRKNGDRKNGNSKSFRPDTDNNTQNGTADNNESSQSVDIFSDLEDNDYPMEELEDNAADREEEVICEDNAAEREEDEETREDDMADREEEEVTRGDNVAEREEEEVTRGDNAADKEQEEVTHEDNAAEKEEEEVTRGDKVAEREEEEVTRGDNAADREQEEVTREDNEADMEEEEVTRGDNAAEWEEEEVNRGVNAADMEEEEVTPGDNAAERDEEEVTRGDNVAEMEEEEVTRGENAAERDEEEVTRGDFAADREQEEVTRGDNVAEREEEEVTRGDNAADMEEEEVTRGDNAADMEEEEVTRGDNVAEREEEEVTRGDNAADREQEEVTRRPPQSTENGTIGPNNSDPPESNGNSELVASKANTNAENPPSTSSKSRKRKPASKPSTTNPKRKREVKVLPRPLSSKKKVPAVPKNVGNLESARSDAGSNGENHIASVNDSSSALSKSPPRKRAPMKEIEANKTIENKGQAIRRPTKSTENRACHTRKNIGNSKSRAHSTHLNISADYSLTTSPSRERQPEKTQTFSKPPREPNPRKSNGANTEETTQLPCQSPGESADRNNSNGRKEQDTVMPLPPNAEGNGRNDLAQRSDNDNTSTREPAQKRRPRRKRKPWNPRPRKTPSVRNKANARPQSDSRRQYQSAQPEQNAVINKSAHEPVENPGHPRTQANAPPTMHMRKIEDEVIQRMYVFRQGETLMRVVESNGGRRVYPVVSPQHLRPLARNQPPIYEVERDPYRMYCYCRSTADGGMIGCDGQNCPHGGWIHYSCAGKKRYTPRGRWYCASCRPHYRDRGKPIYNCPEEVPIAIVKGEPPADGIYGKGPSRKKH